MEEGAVSCLPFEKSTTARLPSTIKTDLAPFGLAAFVYGLVAEWLMSLFPFVCCVAPSSVSA